MPKSHKFEPLADTVKTVKHWYEEVQDLPDALQKRVDADIQKADKLITGLKSKLKKAHNLQTKAREKRIDAALRVKIKATASAKKILNKSKTAYNRATKTVNILTKKIDKAESQLHHAQIREKYYQALVSAFTSVTDLFHKKHGSKHRKVSSKSRKKRKKSK